MVTTNWREHRVAIKILELNREYEVLTDDQPVLSIASPVDSFFECDCCSNLSKSMQVLRHKNKRSKTIQICNTCCELWRAIQEIQSLQLRVCDDCGSGFASTGRCPECFPMG